jgi:hypothetical protein
MLIEKIYQELQEIPEDKLVEIYDLILHIKSELEPDLKGGSNKPGFLAELLAGEIGDEIFGQKVCAIDDSI